MVSDPADPVSVGPAEPVPPPKVKGPLCVGTATITIENLLFGSQVRILYDGVEIGVGEAPEQGSFDFPVPPLGPPAPHGGFVTAQQELCGIWSVPSKPVAVDPQPATIDPPQLSEPLYECGGAVHVTKIHPGSRVYVWSSLLGAPIGEQQVFSDEAVITVAPLLIAGDEIFAVQVSCGRTSDKSNVVSVQGLEDVRPPNVTSPVYSCQKSVYVIDVIPGARVEVYIRGVYRGSAVAGKPEVDVSIIGKLIVGDRVVARQIICDHITDFGKEAIVEYFDGRWFTIGGQEQAQILAVHAALLHTNKILYFGGDQHDATLNTGNNVDHTRLFDCDTFEITPITGLPGSVDLFCAGHSQLEDGRILVGGGTSDWPGSVGPVDPHGHGGARHFTGSRESWIFDPADDHWHQTGMLVTQRANDPTRDPNLDIEATGGKWYPTLLVLPNGRVMAVSGHPRELDTRHNNNTLEWYNIGSSRLCTSSRIRQGRDEGIK